MTTYRMRRDASGKLRRVHVDLGCEGYMVTVTGDCTNCTDTGEYGTVYGPFGCKQCGYTGRRRERVFTPFDGDEYVEAMIRDMNSNDKESVHG